MVGSDGQERNGALQRDLGLALAEIEALRRRIADLTAEVL